MRIAIVSDIHGNRTAFEAVLTDLRETSPDLIFHGGDIAQGGSSPVEVLDQIRDLGWPGVAGNADEFLPMPETLEVFASETPAIQPMLPMIREMGAATRKALGDERLGWLRALPRTQVHGDIALVHASPGSVWKSPLHNATDAEIESIYSPLGRRIVVYGHIHHPFIRTVANITVVNSGSVSMSFDGDPRASYLLIDDSVPSIRRVEYDLDCELKLLSTCGLPHSDWVAKMLIGRQ